MVESGGCEFYVRVDGRVAFVLGIDPVRVPTDRRWHEITLDVPENANGRHEVSFETKPIGPIDFRWALWREPKFLGMDSTEAPAPARTIAPALFNAQSP